MHAGRLKNMLLWEFRGVYRMKERNRGNVRGRRTGRGRGQKGREEVGERDRKNSYLPMAYGFVHLNPLAH